MVAASGVAKHSHFFALALVTFWQAPLSVMAVALSSTAASKEQKSKAEELLPQQQDVEAKSPHYHPQVQLRVMVEPGIAQGALPEVTERTVCLRVQDGNYVQVSAADQGQSIHASAKHCGNPATQWKLVDLNGGELLDGDWVAMYHANYSPLFASCQKDGKLLWSGTQGRDWEQFVVRRVYGEGPIHHGTKVTLQNTARNKFVGARHGGGRSVSCSSEVAREWEQFTLETVYQAVP
eukprot:CAMPEP_0178398752 /NCGR_PEP_ID=MMETSP0689_2-20121128/14932_1 /TAXON_ID=160604 /ORGANISM="Amphidinium massartii, Strain CS-259" /LENGTH=235 /DNA_ID=CAMNT_0020019519 /DNA_START=146 /DNA_END=853 /DNA_ORIENTATION=-